MNSKWKYKSHQPPILSPADPGSSWKPVLQIVEWCHAHLRSFPALLPSCKSYQIQFVRKRKYIHCSRLERSEKSTQQTIFQWKKNLVNFNNIYHIVTSMQFVHRKNINFPPGRAEIFLQKPRLVTTKGQRLGRSWTHICCSYLSWMQLHSETHTRTLTLEPHTAWRKGGWGLEYKIKRN